MSHSVRIKAASGAAQINVPNISGDTPLMGCSVSEGEQAADVRRGGGGLSRARPCGRGALAAAAFVSSCGFFGRRRVSGAQLAAVVVISSAGWVLQDILQVVRRWVWW